MASVRPKHMLERLLKQCGTTEHMALGLPAPQFQRLRLGQTQSRIDAYLAVLEPPAQTRASSERTSTYMDHDVCMATTHTLRYFSW